MYMVFECQEKGRSGIFFFQFLRNVKNSIHSSGYYPDIKWLFDE